MATKKELLDHVDLMCADDSPVSFQNKGAFLLKLFMYPVVGQVYIIENLSIAVMSAHPNTIEVMTIYRIVGAESQYEYLVEYNLVCSHCDKESIEQVNISVKHFPSMCSSCFDLAHENSFNDRPDVFSV